MAKAKKPAVFDVSHPGKSGVTASGNSRHVVVGNRPLIKDPMLSDTVVIDDRETAQALPASTKKVITPVHEDVAVEAPAAEPEALDPKTPIGELVADEEPVAVPDKDELVETQRLNEERVDRLRRMIEDEEYFLPINAVEERRSRRSALLGLLLIVLLAVAWYNIALDAGLLPNTYNLPHTQFFSIN
jgi:hypothetical protein